MKINLIEIHASFLSSTRYDKLFEIFEGEHDWWLHCSRYSEERTTEVSGSSIKISTTPSRTYMDDLGLISFNVKPDGIAITDSDIGDFILSKELYVSVFGAILAITPTPEIAKLSICYSGTISDRRNLNFDIYTDSKLTKIGKVQSNRIRLLSNSIIESFDLSWKSQLESRAVIKTPTGTLTLDTSNISNSPTAINVEHEYTQRPISSIEHLSAVLNELHDTALGALNFVAPSNARK